MFFWFFAFLDVTFLDFLLTIFFWGLFKKLSVFVFGKFQKISLIQLLVFLFLVINKLFPYIVSRMIQKDHFSTFSTSLLKKYLVSYSLFVSVQKKKSPQKIPDSLDFFSLLVFWVCFLFLCRLFLFTHLVVTLLVLFFLLHASSPLVCSLHVYLLSLMFLLFVFIPFFSIFLNLCYLFFVFCWKKHSFLNWSSLFVKLFWFYRFFLFRPFSGCFFSKKNSVLSNKIEFTLFFGSKKPLVQQIPPRISFLIFCDRIFF